MKTHIRTLSVSLVVAAAVALQVLVSAHAAETVDMQKRAEELKNLKWGMFICWSFSTFSGSEWTEGKNDVAFFKATEVDTDQWAKTAKEAGMGYILFLTKHVDGFCLWDTQTTEHKVTKAPLGKDVLKLVRESCDKYGIKLALYYCEADIFGKRPEIKKAQLKELLTRYGPIEFLWLDHGYNSNDGGLSHEETTKWCHECQPATLVGYNSGQPSGEISLRECGKAGPLGNAGVAGYNHANEGKFQGYLLAEFTYPILPDHQGGAMWFYSLPQHDGLCHPAEKLYQDYLGAVQYGNIFSIDVGPDCRGRLREIDVKTLSKVGGMIRAGAAAAKETSAIRDGQPSPTWNPAAGRTVSLADLRVSLAAANPPHHWSVNAEPVSRKVQERMATGEYRITLTDGQHSIPGSARWEVVASDKPGEDAVLCRSELKFEQPVSVDLTVQHIFEVAGPQPKTVLLPERAGRATSRPMQPGSVVSGRFELGAGAAAGDVNLGMPVLDFCWDNSGAGSQPLRLAVAADPYCGSSIAGSAPASAEQPLKITVATTYKASAIPLTDEKRTISLEFHRRGVDGTLRSFYRTIPEIEPGPAWTHGVHLVYYDYLSEQGEGWFKDLQVLADRIPAKDRGRVAVCLHGWYDYFQQYAYDHQRKTLSTQWTAFPGTLKVPMSLESMHKRIKFSKDLGFRTLLYFADGTNSDSGAPNFRKEYLLKAGSGGTFAGWKGPDSLGQPLKMDPSVPGLRDWYRGYLTALLDEYAKEVDGFVWDETFYIPVGFVSYPPAGAAYADRAMMGLVADLTKMVQQRHAQNPDLVFLASDNGETSYALVAHGTWQDSACSPDRWGPSMMANYRNCLWSCNWAPMQHPERNAIAATQYGLPQGVSNGWGDNRGPHNMPPELLAQILERFQQNVNNNRVRARLLNEVEAGQK